MIKIILTTLILAKLFLFFPMTKKKSLRKMLLLFIRIFSTLNNKYFIFVDIFRLLFEAFKSAL